MRLRPERIEAIAKKIAAALRGHARVKIAGTVEQVERAAVRIIQADLRREEDLEKEAEQILAGHRQKIDRHNMSYNTLVAKTKLELAKQRKIVL